MNYFKRAKTTKQPKSKKLLVLKGGLFFCLLLFVLVNWICFNHAYSFTHTQAALKGQRPNVYGIGRAPFSHKMHALFFGISIPKSQNHYTPQGDYESVIIGDKLKLSGWLLPALTDSLKGAVILWHGYGGAKSHLLEEAAYWQAWGYQCLLVDFRGHGDSEGTATTIGAAEAVDVKLAVDWLRPRLAAELPIHLFGTSMGSVAILKAAHDYGDELGVKSLILECPFGSLRHAVLSRFKLLGVPTWGFADLLLFWGGVQHGFWAHSHSSVRYAQKISLPSLLIYGRQDRKVGIEEVNAVLEALQSENKSLKIFDCAGHNAISGHCPNEWQSAITDFLAGLN